VPFDLVYRLAIPLASIRNYSDQFIKFHIRLFLIAELVHLSHFRFKIHQQGYHNNTKTAHQVHLSELILIHLTITITNMLRTIIAPYYIFIN
jgi:hypothetical protein